MLRAFIRTLWNALPEFPFPLFDEVEET